MIKVLNLFYDAHYPVPVRVDILYMRTARSTPEKKIYIQDLILYRDLVVDSPIEIE